MGCVARLFCIARVKEDLSRHGRAAQVHEQWARHPESSCWLQYLSTREGVWEEAMAVGHAKVIDPLAELNREYIKTIAADSSHPVGSRGREQRVS